MKRIITHILLLVLLTWSSGMLAIEHTFTDTSVLKEGSWVKIRVSSTGIYRLTYEQLVAAGLRLDSKHSVRVYGYGGALLPQSFNVAMIDDLPVVPIHMEKGSDGVFGEGDYILFYAQGPVAVEYLSNLYPARFGHTRNHYSDYGYYFLTDRFAEPVLIEEGEDLSDEPSIDIDRFDDYQLYEKDLVNLVDANYGIEGGGREFYGEIFNEQQSTRSFTFHFNDIDATQTARIYADLASKSTARAIFTITANGKTLATTANDSISALSLIDQYKRAITGSVNKTTLLSTGNSQPITLTYKWRKGIASTGWLNYIEVTAISRLTLKGDMLRFRSHENAFSPIALRYHLSGANSRVCVWDVTNLAAIEAVSGSLSGDTLIFTGSNRDKVHEYVAFRPNGSFPSPEIVSGKTAYNQNLHGLRDVEMVIITPDAFYGAAERLADAHREKDHLTVEVVTEEQVFNEFSSGTPDATAYRRLMKMLYDRGSKGGTRPKSLLLLGRGTFDNRKLLPNSGDRILLTYQAKNSVEETKAYATDDYFAFMLNTEGESDNQGRMAFGVGRLPARDAAEADVMVDKTIRYMDNPTPGQWQAQLLFLADDGDSNQHTIAADSAAERVRIKNPNFKVEKLYLDAYNQTTSASGERYPVAENRLHNLLSNGVLMMDYCGHGSAKNITTEQVLTTSYVESMNNKNIALWMMATCSFSHFDTWHRSIAEHALFNPNGGAVAVISACRTVYANQNDPLNRAFVDTLFAHAGKNNYYMSIGEALRCAKNEQGSQENKMPYLLFGDPALQLNVPCAHSIEVTALHDSLHALDIDTLRGVILTAAGDTAKTFTGTVYASILDKIQTITTYDNDQSQQSEKKPYTYVDYPNMLFNGSARVDSGLFAMPFLMPKDIRYNYGNGRIVLYADGTITSAEGDSLRTDAWGSYHDFYVGGTSTSWYQDSKGPDMHIYLNNPLFQNGGTTHNTPIFFADLEDEHGINTSGNGIGHDLTLIIDHDVKQTYNMNNYYTAAEGTYTAGQVRYQLSSLSDGSHHLFFRAWDLLNNSSSASLDFDIVAGHKPEIYRLMVGPNPASTSETITWYMDYDREAQECTIQLRIFTLQGECIWQSEQTNERAIQWNVSNSNATPGLYIYRLQIKGPDSDYSVEEGKIMIR